MNTARSNDLPEQLASEHRVVTQAGAEAGVVPSRATYPLERQLHAALLAQFQSSVRDVERLTAELFCIDVDRDPRQTLIASASAQTDCVLASAERVASDRRSVPFASFINSVEKFVVTSTVTVEIWANSKVVRAPLRGRATTERDHIINISPGRSHFLGAICAPAGIKPLRFAFCGIGYQRAHCAMCQTLTCWQLRQIELLLVGVCQSPRHRCSLRDERHHLLREVLFLRQGRVAGLDPKDNCAVEYVEGHIGRRSVLVGKEVIPREGAIADSNDLFCAGGTDRSGAEE